ncbi:MAG: L-lysine 6-transaminase [Candidatus Marinimicrobia bacterium]|nr:L-lysine 6-transaminase [Candidatus Neomarinimicrobiota bacterium]
MKKINYRNAKETISQRILADGMDLIIDLDKSHGSWLVDGRDGREYLDLFSMFASMPVGYNHPYIIENKERLVRSTINKPTNSDIYSMEMAQFIETMGNVAQPSYLPHAFYVEGGALGVENALKTAFDWKVQKNISKGIEGKGSQIIHLSDCFHGRTGYTLSLTDSPDKRKTKFFPKFDWPRVINPKINFPMNDLNLEKVKSLEDESIRQIKDAIHDNENDIAALILEPIQGEGGDNHFRCNYFQKLRQLADENDFLLIYDEVQTGIGITGRMWAHQHFDDNANRYGKDKGKQVKTNTRPDIIAFGKKTQCCGIFAGTRIDEIKDNVFSTSSRLNSTWGGSLSDMVRFTMYLEIIEKERLVDKAEKNGKYLLNKLEKLQDEFFPLVNNARGRGLFCAFDLPDSETRDSIVSGIMNEGAVILGSGIKTMRFRPHLNISQSEIDLGISIITKALERH